MEENEDIDIRSEAVRDYLEQIPNSLIRWGSTVIFIVVLIGLSLTWIIRYPVLIHSEFKLTTQIEPKTVVAKFDGRLQKVLIANHEEVQRGQLLGYLESSAKHEEVLKLESQLGTIRKLFEQGRFKSIDTVKRLSGEHLGDVQPLYQQFQSELVQLISLLGDDYYGRSLKILRTDISDLQSTNEHLKSQFKLLSRDVELARSEFEVNRQLYKEKVIARLDLDREESKLLAKEIVMKNVETAILNNNVETRVIEKRILDLDRQLAEQKVSFLQSMSTLSAAISAWKIRHVLISPSSGDILFSNNLQEMENVVLNQELFYIFEKNLPFIGTLTIPQVNSGKIKVGQRVLIKFHSYPFEEYGMVEGRISTVPQLSLYDNTLFVAMVELPNGLTTNHNKSLSFKYGMAANAEIVTEDLRLIERIFYTIRKIFTVT